MGDRRASIRLSMLLLAALAVALFLSVSPAATAPASVSPYNELNDLFHAYGDSGDAWVAGSPRTWTGGDSTFSVVLPDGRIVWIFSDTFLSPNSGCAPEEPKPCHRRQLFVAPLINNSFIVQEGVTLTKTLYGGTDASPAALIRPPAPNDLRSFYWMGDGTVEGDGTVDGGKMHVFVRRYPLSPGTVPPSAEATDIATFSLPGITLDGITEGISATGTVKPWAFSVVPVGSVAPVTWGAGILEDGSYTYIYGTEEYPLHKFLHVARAPAGQLLTGTWEYFDGTTWSDSPLFSARVLPDVSGELSVVKTTNGYRLVANLGGIGDIFRYHAPNPEGPWTDQQLVLHPPEVDRGAFAYNAHEHPQFGKGKKTVISYNVNGSIDGNDIFADIHVYRPRFIELSGADRLAR